MAHGSLSAALAIPAAIAVVLQGSIIIEGCGGEAPKATPDPPDTSSTCDDSGTKRQPIAPQPGDLVVSEVLADPVGADANKEWIELFVAANTSVDLNGLTIANTKADPVGTKTVQLVDAACMTVDPGEFVVIGSSSEAALNGGLQVRWVAPTLTLYNNTPTTMELKSGGVLIDSAAVPASSSSSTVAVSVSLDPSKMTAIDNDDATAFCNSTSTATFDGRGTPGAANDTCGPTGSTCLDGSAPRPFVSPQPGDVIVSEVFADPVGSDTANAAKEWVEVYVLAASAVDLNGLAIKNTNTSNNSRTFHVDGTACMSVAPGTFAVLGASADTAQNGNTPVSWAWAATGNQLYNSAGAFELSIGTTIIDTAAVLAPVEGVSQSLSPALSTDAAGNDLATSFCAAASTGAFDGIGTPGAANDACP